MIVVAHIVFFLFMWSFIKVMMTPPGKLPDYIKQKIRAEKEIRFAERLDWLYEKYIEECFPF